MPQQKDHVIIEKKDDQTVILKNDKLEIWFSTLGASILKILVKDREGKVQDIVLGYETIEDYLKYQGYLGAIVGRCANRVGKGRFRLNGNDYQLPVNNGPNCNHGGFDGLSFRYFSWIPEQNGITFYNCSPNMDQGFPGSLMLMVNYTLDQDKLRIQYTAASNEDTMCNFTNHTYFNLSGHPVSVKDHLLTVDALRYACVDEDGKSSGQIQLVTDTVFDFRKEKRIDEALLSEDIQIKMAKGIDHSFFVNNSENQAVLYCPQTGIELTVTTTLPAIGIYTANYVGGEPGKYGETLTYQSGICFETQYMPDEINLNPMKAGTILKKGTAWNEETTFQIRIRSQS